MSNVGISSVALPLTATPKWLKWGNKIGIYLCRIIKVKITDIAYAASTLTIRQPKRTAKSIVLLYLCVPEYGMTIGTNLRDAFTPDSTPKTGKNG